MQAGKLNKRISIMRSTPGATDTYGRPADNWSIWFTCWGSIDIQQSSLLYEPSAFVSKVLYRITLRLQKTNQISSANRVQWTNPLTSEVHNYEIQAVLNTQENNREMVLMCYELDGSE